MDYNYLADALVDWIRGQVLSAGRKGVVLGMSGGLDSSVAAVLCQRAFPRDVIGLIMPCYSCGEDAEHARAVAGQFSIPIIEIVLDPVLDTLMEVLKGEDKDEAPCRTAESNLKVRLRMLPLYYYANQRGYTVVGSSNRCELAIGYFTKYGDGGVDIMPLGNLVKGQVRGLASFLGIPRPIIDKPPSAGLWPGQSDEEEIGISYDVLDRYLLTGRAPERIKRRIEARISLNAHKRLPPPVAML
jgi:NAD+ synthase